MISIFLALTGLGEVGDFEFSRGEAACLSGSTWHCVVTTTTVPRGHVGFEPGSLDIVNVVTPRRAIGPVNIPVANRFNYVGTR